MSRVIKAGSVELRRTKITSPVTARGDDGALREVGRAHVDADGFVVLTLDRDRLPATGALVVKTRAADEFRMHARLPSWRSYLARVEDPARRRAVWAWLAHLRPALRRATHIVDFALSPGPGETLDDRWVPIAHDPGLGLWLVRR